MKQLLAVLSMLALAGGMLFGYLETKKAPAPGAGPSPSTSVERVEPPPRTPTTPVVKEAPEPPPAPTPPAVPLPSQKEIDGALKDLEALILKEDFRQAQAAAANIVEKYQGNPQAAALLERIQRVDRKAKVYAVLIASLDTRTLPDPLYKVVFSNGNTLYAKAVKESPDRYDLDYVLGGTGSLTRDRVASVKPVTRRSYLDVRWKEIQAGVAKCKDPLDLFFAGVRKCFRDGLRKEGVSLLDRLLLMPDSGQVVALYAKDPEGNAVRFWEEAAGRAQIAPPKVVEVASEGPRLVDEPPEGGPTGDVDTQSIDRVREMIERAETLSAEGAMFDARRFIESAAKLLYALPGRDERVRDLQRRAAAVLEKVLGDK